MKTSIVKKIALFACVIGFVAFNLLFSVNSTEQSNLQLEQLKVFANDDNEVPEDTVYDGLTVDPILVSLMVLPFEETIKVNSEELAKLK
jgi:hypothetical protein